MKKTSIAALTLALLALLVSPIPGGIVFAVPLGATALGLGITALVKAPQGARLVVSKVAVSLAAGAVVIATTLTAAVPGWMGLPEPTPVTASSPLESQQPQGQSQKGPDEARTQKPESQSPQSTHTENPESGDATEPATEPEGDRDGDDSEGGGRQTVVVTRVIDGDTFEARGLGEGPVPRREVDVRMLEIDTVEEGRCGYAAATDKLASLLGDTVTVERDEELKDQYGRWLLYVWSDSVFVNHEMVETGYAEAALYEPNDKYWQKINAADTSDTYTPWPPCHISDSDEEEGSNEEQGDRYLFPPPPPDRDCGSVSAGDFPVRPGDPHRFDADGDGIGCESTVSEPELPESDPEPPEDDPEPPADDPTGDDYPVPPPPPDVDCSEIAASDFPVRPGDPHRFDADGDGIGCDS